MSKRKPEMPANFNEPVTPAYTVREADVGQCYVLSGRNCIAGPFSNAEAWHWIDQHTIARPYGAA